MIGKVDRKTVILAKKYAIDIEGGSINKKDKRVRIFAKGKFPNAPDKGGALRSRIVWWLNTDELLGINFDIHHKNRDRSDDRFCNLEKLNHRDHSRQHNPSGLKMISCSCKNCGEIFLIHKWRLKDKNRGKFCSQDCYHNSPRSIAHRVAIGEGLLLAYAEGRR